MTATGAAPADEGTELRTVVLGAGPAGTALLVNAHQRGLLPQLLDAGVALVDVHDRMGAGTIGRYVVNSDTVAGTLLECLAGQQSGVLAPVFDGEAWRRLEPLRRSAAPLRLVGDLLTDIGQALRRAVDTHPRSRFLPRTRAVAVHRTADGGYLTTVQPLNGGSTTRLRSRYVVSALGGHQDRNRALAAPIVPGVRLADGYADKVLLTEQVLTDGGPARLQQALTAAGTTRVVIIGGSHSAFSTAWVLLNHVDAPYGPGDITILHRRPPRLFYPSAADAHADGYTDFGPDSLCPLTGRVYRLAGLRLDSRDLLRRIHSIGDAVPERRVRLQALDSTTDDGVTALLGAAAVIVPAFGYRPTTIPIHDTDGTAIPLLGAGPGTPSLVDHACRILDTHRIPVPGLYGLGLASGFALDAALGGEPDFTGQTNGLWLYQNGIGQRIIDQLLEAPR